MNFKIFWAALAVLVGAVAIAASPFGGGSGSGESATWPTDKTIGGDAGVAGNFEVVGSVNLKGTVLDSSGNLTIGDAVDVSGTITSSVAGGGNAIVFSNNTARLVFGSLYITTDGSGITMPGVSYLVSPSLISAGTLYARADITNDTGSEPIRLIDGDGVRFPTTTLPTCGSGNVRIVMVDALSGLAGTGTPGRFCMCTGDGAASPAYYWRNLFSGTAGTTTTCPD